MGYWNEKGTIGNWLVNVGETINNGMKLLKSKQIKLLIVLGDFRWLIRVIAKEGDELPLGHLIGLMSDEDVDEVEIEFYF